MAQSVRALAWGVVTVAILLGGLYALALGFVTLRLAGGAGGASAGVQSAALHAVVFTVAREAVLPVAALALLVWLGLARVAPRVDASWRALALSLLGCALVAFPVVGFTFEAWSPSGVGDVLGTAALLSGSVATALWLARRVTPGLRPGAFAASRR